MVNTIRRITFQNVPIDSFDPLLIKFEKNTSIYHNDYLRKRISNLPVMGVKNDKKRFDSFLKTQFDFIVNHVVPVDDNAQKPDDEQAIYDNVDAEQFKANNDSHNLTLYCHKIHDEKTIDIMNITTDDCKFTVDGKEISNPYKVPLLICKLRYKEEIKFSAISKYSIAVESPLWNSISNCFFIEKAEGDYDFYIIEKGVLTAEEILERVKEIIVAKVKNVQEVIIKNSATGYNSFGELKIENDKFTLPGLLTFYLQDHEDIEYAGYKAEHMLNDTSIIYYRAKDGKDIVNIIKQVGDRIIKEVNALLK